MGYDVPVLVDEFWRLPPEIRAAILTSPKTFTALERSFLKPVQGTEVLGDDGITYRYDQKPDTGVLEWRKWNSSWINYGLNPQAITFSSVNAKYRYHNGQVIAYVAAVVSGGSGEAWIGNPVPMAFDGLQTPLGKAWSFQNRTTMKPFDLDTAGTNFIRFATFGGTNPSASYTVNAGLIGVGLTLTVAYTYEPA